MKVGNKKYKTIWINESDNRIVSIIDQRFLPHKFVIENLTSVNEFAKAITEMHLRGAGLIGAAGAYGMYLAALEANKKSAFDEYLFQFCRIIKINQAYGR